MHKLKDNTTGPATVQVYPLARPLYYDFSPLRHKFGCFPIYVIHEKSQVVQSFPVLLKEFRVKNLALDYLYQLNLQVTQVSEGKPYIYRVPPGISTGISSESSGANAEHPFPGLDNLLAVPDHDTDVVNRLQFEFACFRFCHDNRPPFRLDPLIPSFFVMP